MAREKLSVDQARPSDLPLWVSISVTQVPNERAGSLRETRASLSKTARSLRVVLALVAAIVVAVVAVLLPSGRTDATRQGSAATERAATAAVAAAFGYPQRCLSVTISAADPEYASARVDRGGVCAGYRGYVNASFHRVQGVWRLVLDEGQLFVPNALLTPAAPRSTAAGSGSGYPLGCLSVEITVHDPRFTRAGFDRRLPCVRHADGP